MYGGTAVTIVGVVVTVLSASVVGTLEADVAYLLELWANPLWLAYLVFCGAFGAFLQGTHKAYEAARLGGSPLPYSDYVLPVTYATFSALFGTISVVLAKILSELVTLMLADGVNIFWGRDAWFTYATLFGWLAFVGVWLFRMNEALSLYDPLFIIPLLQVNFILFAIVSGGIYFKEFSYFGPMHTAGFLCGVMLLVTGIFLLSPEIHLGEEEGSGGDGEDGGDGGKATPEGGGDGQESAEQASPKPLPVATPSLMPRTLSLTKRTISSANLAANLRSSSSSSAGDPTRRASSTFSSFRFNAVVRKGEGGTGNRNRRACARGRAVIGLVDPGCRFIIHALSCCS